MRGGRFMTRRVWLPLMLVAAATVLVARADSPTTPKPEGNQGSGSGVDTKPTKDDTLYDSVRLESQIREFKNNLLVLKSRLEKNGTEDDRKRAEAIGRVIDRMNDGGLESKIKIAVDDLRKDEGLSVQKLQQLIAQNKEIAGELRYLISMLTAD